MAAEWAGDAAVTWEAPDSLEDSAIELLAATAGMFRQAAAAQLRRRHPARLRNNCRLSTARLKRNFPRYVLVPSDAGRGAPPRAVWADPPICEAGFGHHSKIIGPHAIR